MVAQVVAAVRQLVQDGLGQRETPATLGHGLGHGNGRQVDVDGRAVVGTAKVSRTAFPDPTAPKGEDWTSVELSVDRPLPTPVTLDQLKADPCFRDLLLLRQSRLSVMPVPAPLFAAILKRGQALA